MEKTHQKQLTSNFMVVPLMLPKKQLDLVAQFLKDVYLAFGTDKCAYLTIEEGKIVSGRESFIMINLP